MSELFTLQTLCLTALVALFLTGLLLERNPCILRAMHNECALIVIALLRVARVRP